MKRINILCLILPILFFSCTSKSVENHQKFLSDVQKQRKMRTPEQYQVYLKKQLQKKRSELSQLNSILNENERQYQDRENQDSPLNSYASAGQINMNSMRMNNENLIKQKRIVENEIFFLQSQIKMDN